MGKPVKSFKGGWEQACAAAGVPGLLFHDLRRTAVRSRKAYDTVSGDTKRTTICALTYALDSS